MPNILDIIMYCISAVIILIVGAGLYVFVISKLLPHFLLVPSYKKHETADRGIAKYNFPNGRSVVYEPEIKYRRFLKKYVLFAYNDKKYIKCKLANDVDSIRYEVAVYNNKNKLVKVIEAAENISKKGETKNVELPADASYASVVLKRVNEEESFDTLRRMSSLNIGIFAAITSALTVAYGLFVRGLILKLAELAELSISVGLSFNVVSSLVVGFSVALLCVLISKKRILGER